MAREIIAVMSRDSRSMVRQEKADTGSEENADGEEPGAMSADGEGLEDQTEPQGGGNEEQGARGTSRQDAGSKKWGQ